MSRSWQNSQPSLLPLVSTHPVTAPPHARTYTSPGAQLEAGDVKAAASALRGDWVDDLKKASTVLSTTEGAKGATQVRPLDQGPRAILTCMFGRLFGAARLCGICGR